MRTRNSYFPNNSFVTILRRQNKRRTPNVVNPKLRTIVEIAPMADMRNGRICFKDDTNSDSLDFSSYSPQPQYETNISWERFSKIKHAFKDKQYQPEEIQELMSKLLRDVQNINEELSDYTNSLSWNRPIFYDNDEHYREYLEKSSKAITPVLPTEEPEYSLSMRDEHFSTIPETELDELIKSSVEPCPNTNDDKSLSNEDVPMENFKIYSNPLFDDEEINSNKIDPHYFNVESNLIESLPNRDTLFDYSPKFDFLEDFSGELMPTSIINEERIKREHEECISLMEKLLTINSFPRPLENFHANTIIKTLSTSPIPVEDIDSLREEIDIFTGMDDLMPSGIEDDDYDSERDIHFLEILLSNDSIPLPENESSNFDHHDDPSFPRPPLEPPDVEVFFDFEPNSGELISAVMNNIDELNEDECFNPGGGETNVFANIKDDDYFPFIFVIRIFLPYLTYPEVSPLLLSTKSKDTIFDPGIST
uniref:Reverse transcriptase domain-containing protein n=1 Tax=Tanacetum cinerariifolium TaxID=118510 RepID=A0A6L2LRJ0_TANCI|nr:hypothetical protein [Tanacetum cinerariifolium]